MGIRLDHHPRHGRLRFRLAKFSVASAIATGISQLVLQGLYWFSSADAATASTVAFLAGAVPHFLMVRYWAWRPNTGQGQQLAPQLATYVVVTLAGGAAAIGLTALAEAWIAPLMPGTGTHALLLTASYLAGGLPVALAKFAVFDLAFTGRIGRGAHGPGQSTQESTNSVRVRAANPVAPATTSS